ncbi:Aste57867_24034 [Aphanomyces stellatus]|uniref:Aste57867_24034 protein n=1 Tax=Aphanomyces stellatus TaxID=120398 RepID=A0A485LTQ0_9STRA|nr:hypothetical protein As57867_023961 [Aphanomyces stellatus]VFU00677.1 Aste57867_24034 [Aphanomyces stellatus]
MRGAASFVLLAIAWRFAVAVVADKTQRGYDTSVDDVPRRHQGLSVPFPTPIALQLAPPPTLFPSHTSSTLSSIDDTTSTPRSSTPTLRTPSIRAATDVPTPHTIPQPKTEIVNDGTPSSASTTLPPPSALDTTVASSPSHGVSTNVILGVTCGACALSALMVFVVYQQQRCKDRRRRRPCHHPRFSAWTDSPKPTSDVGSNLSHHGPHVALYSPSSWSRVEDMQSLSALSLHPTTTSMRLELPTSTAPPTSAVTIGIGCGYTGLVDSMGWHGHYATHELPAAKAAVASCPHMGVPPDTMVSFRDDGIDGYADPLVWPSSTTSTKTTFSL